LKSKKPGKNETEAKTEVEKRGRTEAKPSCYKHYNTGCAKSLPDLFRGAMRETLDDVGKIWLNR
jgi:hypothetical protein